MAVFFINFAAVTFSGAQESIYNSPIDNATLVKSSENVIIRFISEEVSSASNFELSVTKADGSIVEGLTNILNDGKTLVFDPKNDFDAGDQISVRLSNRNQNRLVKEFSFSVDPSPMSEADRIRNIERIRKEEFGFDYRLNQEKINQYTNLPATEPEITVHVNNNPAPGTIFFGNFAANPHLAAMKSTGEFMFIREMPSPCYDFRVQENGLLTYFQNFGQKYYGMDSNYNVVDSFFTGNGYETDLHDLRLLSNGNALLMSYDVKIIDMSQIVPGGQKDAQVTGLIIQELDPQRNVVFQWRSWDHFQITDADNVNLSLGVIDYCHGNALEIDFDGGIILSSRNMSEITKISRSTGNIIWRLGGKNNQFTFINDPIKFSYQHAIRRTAAGTYTLFDNGNFHVPKFSRAVEYLINENSMTCELVWEFRRDPIIYSFAMGYAERLPNGNTSVSWGFSNTTYTEVTQAGETAYEFSLGNLSYSYRVVKENWFVKPLSVNQQTVEEFDLTYNYPNPFNGSTVINFTLPNNSNVTLTVYNALGKEVSKLISNQFTRAGKHEIRFVADKYSSGLYYYSLRTEAGTKVHKMMLIR